MQPLFFCLAGLAVLLYALFLWAGGKFDGNTNPLSPETFKEYRSGDVGDIDKDQDPDSFYFTLFAWVAIGLFLVGLGLFKKFFGQSVNPL